ncbi:MAG: PQQ-dependent sugar dehydrogenase, partial [Vulcanimicrobiaceae bacterium]
MRVTAGIAGGMLALVACGGGAGATGSRPSPKPAAAVTAGTSRCTGGTPSQASRGPAPAVPTGLTVPSGFMIQTIASVGDARELATLPNGDLIVGTGGPNVYIVPNAEGGSAAGKPRVFATIADPPDASVAFSQPTCTVYLATQHGIYSTPYRDGDLAAESLRKIASVRTGDIPPNTDGDVHRTTSVAVSRQRLYAGVGSSCNACVETDPTRASIQRMSLKGAGMTTLATRIRNPIALAIDPANGHLWVGVAGQDHLPGPHPYEFLDDVTSHGGFADYGWPDCEEDHVAYTSGANCSGTVIPLVELPAYSTIIGAVFYP